MKITLINNNYEINKLFERAIKNNFNYSLKIINILKVDEIKKYLNSNIKEYFFINIDMLEPRELISLKQGKYEVSIDKVIFLSTTALKRYQEIIYSSVKIKDNEEYKEEIVKKISDKLEKKLKLCTRHNVNSWKNTHFTDENLNEVLEYSSGNSSILSQIIVIGSSIGGVNVLEEIIKNMNGTRGYPPIVITQHILSNFANNMVERLKSINDIFTYNMVNSKMELKNNNIYFSNGKNHLIVEKEGSKVYANISTNLKTVNKHIPSINVLYRSVANIYGSKAIGIILTGMGKDGIVGMGELYLKGAYTIAQNKESSVVHGIAGSSIEEGFIKEELKVIDIVKKLNYLTKNF